MEPTDLTLAVLREIRDEIKNTRQELKAEIRQTNERLDVTNERLDRLERVQVESEMRLATAVGGVNGAIQTLKEFLATRLDFKEQLEEHERRIGLLEQRTGH